MLDEASRVGWPRAYTDDLYLYDRLALEKYSQEKLVWVLREHGTHLYPTLCENSHEASYYRGVIAYWAGDHKLNYSPDAEGRARYYLISADAIKEITWREAQDAIEYHAPGTEQLKRRQATNGFGFD
jgi:hypothetical protein